MEIDSGGELYQRQSWQHVPVQANLHIWDSSLSWYARFGVNLYILNSVLSWAISSATPPCSSDDTIHYNDKHNLCYKLVIFASKIHYRIVVVSGVCIVLHHKTFSHCRILHTQYVEKTVKSSRILHTWCQL